MRVLPPVPTEKFGDNQGRYLAELVKRLELELSARPRLQRDGALYVSLDDPLHVISPNGTVYRLGVSDVGALTTTEVML